MSEAQPFFRCKDENHSEYEDEGYECISCGGKGTIVPGPYDGNDHLLIRRYVYAQWWVRLREMKRIGMKLGKKKQRDKRIKKQALDLFTDFKRMGKKEQRTLRMSMAGAVEDFKNLDNEGTTCAS